MIKKLHRGTEYGSGTVLDGVAEKASLGGEVDDGSTMQLSGGRASQNSDFLNHYLAINLCFHLSFTTKM